MAFDSLIFLQFFVVVYALHRLLAARPGLQRGMLLAASYLFYMAWDYRFITLLFYSTAIDYVTGYKIAEAPGAFQRRLWLWISMVSNLSLLFLFKYLDFSLSNLNAVIGWLWPGTPGFTPPGWVLPVGISFYTFQSMSYTIDIYRGTLRPVRNLGDFMLYVAFFPQLVAGPIVKSSEFLPQLDTPYRHDDERFFRGLFFVLLGYVKKSVIADPLGMLFCDPVFANPAAHTSLDAWMAAYAYTFQIYCDFSGYSDIAIGCSLMLGFHLPANFDSPYLATNPKEFWRRWHISLSTWIRDYLYIPLGGSRGGANRIALNLMLAMTLGGLWHGASWNFVIWGMLHGGLLVACHRGVGAGLFKHLPVPVRGLLFFHFVVLTWIFFRCQDLGVALSMLESMGSFSAGDSLSLTPWLLFMLGAIGVHQLGVGPQEICATRFARAHLIVPLLATLAVALALTQVHNMFQAQRAFIYFQF